MRYGLDKINRRRFLFGIFLSRSLPILLLCWITKISSSHQPGYINAKAYASNVQYPLYLYKADQQPAGKMVTSNTEKVRSNEDINVRP